MKSLRKLIAHRSKKASLLDSRREKRLSEKGKIKGISERAGYSRKSVISSESISEGQIPSIGGKSAHQVVQSALTQSTADYRVYNVNPRECLKIRQSLYAINKDGKHYFRTIYSDARELIVIKLK